jgi:hypothetical protein
MLWKSVESLEDAEISPVIRGYFHGLSQDEAHEVVLSIFLKEAQEHSINKAFLARRLGKSPEQITRWLGAPGNWTSETYTNLLIAMGYKPKYGAEKLADMRQSNRHNPDVDYISTQGAPVKLNLISAPEGGYKIDRLTGNPGKSEVIELSLTGVS